ncbi:hypothetical protein ACQPZF_13320 [Actinosynnema sp. CS-041913]|uniref:hypothetical protein n=1 Tax=Actinosynnema sp. CS-041913 TaxID=3239917 RepID=UPI003D8E3966
MAELSVRAIAAAVDEHPEYRRVAAFEGDAAMLDVAETLARFRGTPVGRLRFLADDHKADVAVAALAALGPPDEPQPLLLVRADPDPDPFVAVLPRIVHDLPWVSEELGITHLEELSGTAVVELLSWLLDERGATVVIADQPPVVVGEPKPLSAVALRVSHGGGPLRITGWGSGEPAPSTHVFGGPGPCDGWRGLSEAVADGRVVPGHSVTVEVRGPALGWVRLEAGGG